MKYFIVFLLLFIVSCTTTDGGLKLQEPGAIRIIEKTNQSSLVFLNGTLIDTLTEGELLLTGIPIGTQKVTLFSAGNALFNRDVLVTAGDSTDVVCDLEETESGDLTITSDSGALVSIGDLEFSSIDKSGIFELKDFPTGEYHISVSSGSKSVDTTIGLVKDKNMELSIKLSLQQQVLIEHISNVSCNYCPEHAETMYHILDSMGWKNISKISYNANWPAKDDPLYLFNPEPQMDRTMEYGGKVNFALPIFVVNGEVLSFDADGVKLKSLLIDRIAREQKKTPRFDISLSEETVRVVSLSEDEFEGKIYVHLVQDRVEYDKAPGSNGEKLFRNAFRRNILEKVLTLESGDTKEFSFTINSEGLPSTGLRLTAFIQISDGAILQTTDLKL